jgi:tRNA pseudouridine13 synthase
VVSPSRAPPELAGLRVRERLEDFYVEEVPLYRPKGEGEHTFLQVEKRDCDTEAVARQLARAAGVAPRDVGYAGRKDRRAVARQWFSVPRLDPERALALPLRHARVLEAARHPHKLRTGQLRANRFAIAVRGLDAAQVEQAAAQLGRVQSQGMPNRFGPQRFGRDGRNVERARALVGSQFRATDRRAARFLVSALQAAVFNEVLVHRGPTLAGVEWGDVALVHASGGLFRVEDEEREASRAERFEISATGPIFGSRVLAPGGRPARREAAVLRRFGIAEDEPPGVLAGVRVRGARRPLRVRPDEVDFSVEGDVLRLRFLLPPGSYATVLLEELLGRDEPHAG